MDGQAVYKFAVGTVPKVVAEAVEKAGLAVSEIDCFVLHQANSRIITVSDTMLEELTNLKR